MVAYLVLLFALVAFLFFVFYRMFTGVNLWKVITGTETKAERVARKEQELAELRRKSRELEQEVSVTRKLVNEDERVNDLADELDELESDRNNKE